MAEWSKMCCAIDFSEACRFAMLEAADLANRFHAQLTLVHVYEPSPPGEVDVLAPKEELFEMVSVDLERSLAAWRSEAARRVGASVRSRVRVGDPAEEIVHFAREEGMDLVVLGSHGCKDVGRHVVLGSVAERVVREAPCPVLVIRQKELGEITFVGSTAAHYA